MIGSQRLFPDVQGALVQRLGFCVLSLVLVEVRQTIQRICHLGMVGSQRLSLTRKAR